MFSEVSFSFSNKKSHLGLVCSLLEHDVYLDPGSPPMGLLGGEGIGVLGQVVFFELKMAWWSMEVSTEYHQKGFGQSVSREAAALA